MNEMRIAILALTEKSFELAEKISATIGGKIFVKGRDFEQMKIFVEEIFTKFDALIFICAAGIAVRMIAPHLKSKLTDPAVIVIDERGRNVISLLSGHVGGANDLTLKISEKICANPVITTATDVEEKFSADNFASRLGILPEPKDAIKAINSAILRGEEIFLTAGNVRLNLTPKNLICGIGCRRNVSEEKISRAVHDACQIINQPVERIKFFATIDIKRDEQGLIDFAKNLGREIKFFTAAELSKKILEYKLDESDFVKKNIGVGNVCEAAVLCSVARAKFALPKTKFDEVTIALVWENLP
ncbi:MAG: cobalt-precorrin 5A hydrolase [Selenomonadaceae bacterium]|nr:cobalt-precorrin 5A hydrolase [Selenomonadaceae bacterium]